MLFSIGQRIRFLKHGNFVEMTTRFRDAVERSFGVACALEASALRGPFIRAAGENPDDIRKAERINRNNVFLTTDNLADITPFVWKKAAYVRVDFTPEDPALAQTHKASVEFGAPLPRRATFSITPGDRNIRDIMAAANAGRVVRDDDIPHSYTTPMLQFSTAGAGLGIIAW